VVVLPGPLVTRLLAGPLGFRDRTIARVAAPDKLVLERGPRRAVFTLAEGTWKMTQPVAAGSEQADLEELFKGLNPLRAGELVADKAADQRPFGLDRPQARLAFFDGDKEILNLLVGGAEKGKDGKGSRAYAKLTGSDLIFLLDPSLTTRVLAEYRSRKVWTPSAPDAAQVEKITFGYAMRPFVLQKVETDWHVAGKPEAKVNAGAVRDTLDALAGLRADHYAADAGADFKLYGLQPPALALEVETPSGKRTLHIGRPEGDSKRFYATIPGAEGTRVFVLSEADAARIVRQLPAFLANAASPSADKQTNPKR
jgi:hypothetical protein